jgi:N-methylhydantoinase A
MARGEWRLAVDVGGTFTDVVLMNETGAVQLIGKVLTTPKDPAAGVMQGIQDVLVRSRAALGDVRYVIHGTTLITNALIERKGARTGLITTAGHEDNLEIGRETRYDSYDLFLEKLEPLVPRSLRIGLSARMLSDGTELSAFDPSEVRRAAAALRQAGAEAIAVSLLHSYRNPAHERAVEAVLSTVDPAMRVSLSSVVVGEIREYERTSTTVANAYVLAVAETYLRALSGQLRSAGFSGELLLMLSSGGTCTIETACTVPIRLLESGPAGGAAAAAEYARRARSRRVLSFDMGGTTAKACFIDDGEPEVTREFEVARVWRFKQGSGLPLIAPVIELIEIGAGGGSIARVDRMGLPKVGPDSAGSEPGPACYGRGGTLPTVTDANLVLGYLDPGYFLGGAMPLDAEAAREAIRSHLAEKIGVSIAEAAWGIHAIVSENMANAARMHAVERGKEVGDYDLYGYGGAGPLHACAIAERLGISRIIIPPGAGARSCFGFLASPLAFEVARSHATGLEDADWVDVARTLERLEEEARGPLALAGVPSDQIWARRWCEMRFQGQGYEVEVSLQNGRPDESWQQAVRAEFERVYRSLYRHFPNGPVEIVTWRVRVQTTAPALPAMSPAATSGKGLKGERLAYVATKRSFEQVPVYDRYALSTGFRTSGPVIVEEVEATTLVTPGFDLTVDTDLNLVLTRNG